MKVSKSLAALASTDAPVKKPTQGFQPVRQFYNSDLLDAGQAVKMNTSKSESTMYKTHACKRKSEPHHGVQSRNMPLNLAKEIQSSALGQTDNYESTLMPRSGETSLLQHHHESFKDLKTNKISIMFPKVVPASTENSAANSTQRTSPNLTQKPFMNSKQMLKSHTQKTLKKPKPNTSGI